MPANGEVVIIVAGEDQSGTVMQAVEQNLARVQARATAADRAITSVGGHAVPAMAAASASVRVLDGDFSHLLRAEERFLSTLPGAQALMQAAFPVIGILAVSEGIYRMGSAVTDFIQKMTGMAGTIEKDFGDANLEVAKSNDTLRVTNDRLSMSIAKLEKKPGNGLQLALDEARVSADNLASSLIKDNEKISEMMDKDSVGRFAGFFTLQESTGDAEDIQKRHVANVRSIAFAGQQAERAAKTADEAKAARLKEQKNLYQELARAGGEAAAKIGEIEKTKSEDAKNLDLYGPEYTPHVNQDALENDLKGLSVAYRSQQENVELTDKNESLEAEQKVAQAKHDQLDAQRQLAREAAEERKREEEYLKRVEKLGIGDSKQAGTARAAQDAKMLQESNREAAEALDSTIEATGKAWVTDAEAAVKSSKEQIDALRQVQEGRMKAAGEDYKSVDQDTQYGVKTGQMGEAQRYAALRNAATQEYEIKRDALEQMKELDSISPDDPQKVQRDLDEIVELQKAYSQQMVTLTQQQMEQQRSATEGYVKFIIDPLVTGTDTVSKRFKKMADNILSELQRVAANKAVGAITDGLLSGRGSKSGSSSVGLAQQAGGIGSSVLGLLGGLFGRKGSSGKASNGGLATGAGTIADSVTSGLQQGGGSSGGSGAVVVNLITQGTPQTATSTGSSGGGGLEQMVISVVLKDADQLGPMSKALGGAISMIGSG